MRPWMRGCGEDGSCLSLHVQPGATRTGLAGLHGNALKLRVAAPPVEGAANAAVLAYMAERLKLTQREMRIAHGEKSRRKTVWVALSPEEIELRLKEDLA